MLLFDISRPPVEFLKPSIVARPKDRHQTESKERVISVLLLLCVLAAGVYGEILRYAF